MGRTRLGSAARESPSLSDFLYAMAAAVVLAFLSWLVRTVASSQKRRVLRSYTLLGTKGDDGSPLLFDTTRPQGSIVVPLRRTP